MKPHKSRNQFHAAAIGSITKLSPLNQARNPVMFIVYAGAMFLSLLYAYMLISGQQVGHEPEALTLWVAVWLWISVISSNFAESLAEDKSKTQTNALRALRKEVSAKRLYDSDNQDDYEIVSASSLHKDDIVLVEAGDFIPGDGQVIEGIASVDESAITGESAPVIRESGGDFDIVTGGTRVLSSSIVVRITTSAGESYIDKMVRLVEGAKRQKTPNEITLLVFLSAQTLSVLITIATLIPFSIFSVTQSQSGTPASLTVLVALLVCLAPTTIGGLLSAIGISGMNRLLKANVVASSGRAVEAAGDVNVLMLDKTGTITYGNRQADEIFAADGVSTAELAEACYLASYSDQTPEGRSIVALMRNNYGVQEMQSAPANSTSIEFCAESRFSGIEMEDRQILKGASDSIERHLSKYNISLSVSTVRKVEDIARMGGTPLVVAEFIGESKARVLGVVHLKDVVKSGIKERLADLRRMGIKSIMITGDNPLTAGAIAAEAGVDDYLAQATPEMKLKLIRKMQAGGELVAMVGDGTNDAPALAQSDVAVVMNSGTQAAKEAGNMIDLDSDPTKLIEIVEIGKQLLMTRGSLTTFSITNELAKYFALIPAAFASTYPQLEAINIMHLASPESAVLSAVIYNALIIVVLIPLALRGVRYRPVGAGALLRHNLAIYGLGGLLMPFVCIKLLDLLLVAMGAA